MSSIVIINNFLKPFSCKIIEPIRIKLSINVSYYILHRNDVGIFNPLKNMEAVTKNRM